MDRFEAMRCYVQVLEADNGKWPDVCGTTDASNDVKTRYFYKSERKNGKPKFLPKAAWEEYDRIKSTYSCEETKLSRCEFMPWDSVKLYHISEDLRAGCDKASAKECK